MADKLLTPEHEKVLRDMLAQIQVARSHIDDAERAGLDMGDARKQLDANELQINKFLKVYFPVVKR